MIMPSLQQSSISSEEAAGGLLNIVSVFEDVVYIGDIACFVCGVNNA